MRESLSPPSMSTPLPPVWWMVLPGDREGERRGGGERDGERGGEEESEEHREHSHTHTSATCVTHVHRLTFDTVP